MVVWGELAFRESKILRELGKNNTSTASLTCFHERLVSAGLKGACQNATFTLLQRHAEAIKHAKTNDEKADTVDEYIRLLFTATEYDVLFKKIKNTLRSKLIGDERSLRYNFFDQMPSHRLVTKNRAIRWIYCRICYYITLVRRA